MILVDLLIHFLLVKVLSFFFFESSLDVFFFFRFCSYYVLYIMHQLQFVLSGSAILILEIKIQLQYIVSLFPCVPCILHYIKIEINTFMDNIQDMNIYYISLCITNLKSINRTHAQTSGFFNSSEIKLFLDFLGWLPITNHHWIIIEYDTFVIRSRLVLLPRLLRHALDLARHRRSTRRCAASGADNGCGAVEFNQENLGLSVEETI